ncbi:hypothetical protein QL285_039350 [Trifolium repens]|nr:hypothetical protein QL285_039350 [Trifolium repens]
MKTFFCSQDLWDIVDEGFTIPQDTSTLNTNQKKELKEIKQKDSKALFFLQQAVEDSIFPRIMGATSAKDAWGTLKEEFEGSDKVCAIKLQTLRREFELLKMKESETAKDYYTKIKELVSQMRSYGDNILDKRIVEKILISIPRKYDAIVTTIEQTKDLSSLSVTELIGSLEAYERLSRHDDNTTENVFQSKHKLWSRDKRYGEKENGRENTKNEENSRNFSKKNQDEYPPCGICKRINHAEKYCQWRGEEKCRYCKKFGHEEKNCYSKNKHQANFVEEHECGNDQHDYEQYLFYATQDSNDELSNNWYLDSGCSNHMAKDESIFKGIDDSVKVKVRPANGTVIESKGKGTVMVETKKGMRFIKDVLLVHNLKGNLLSIGQMMEKDYILHFEGDTCSIYDNSHKRHEIAKVKMEKRNRSFPINFKYTPIPQSNIENMEEAKEEPGTPPSPPQQKISPPESTSTRAKSLVNIYMKLATFPCLILKAIKWRQNNNFGPKAIKKKFHD